MKLGVFRVLKRFDPEPIFKLPVTGSELQRHQACARLPTRRTVLRTLGASEIMTRMAQSYESGYCSTFAVVTARWAVTVTITQTRIFQCHGARGGDGSHPAGPSLSGAVAGPGQPEERGRTSSRPGPA